MKENLSATATLTILARKLDQLEKSIKGNIPKPAILQVITGLKRTAIERKDYTRY